MKVILGLSGGVDSSVALKLLKDEGYDVEAMFMRNWDSATNNDIMGNPDIDDDVCPQEKDYQDAEKVLTIPNRKVELPDGVRKLWTDIMLHCVQEDLEKGQFQRALDRARHYLIFFPDDSTFLDFRNRAEQELKKAQDSRNPENQSTPDEPEGIT